MSDLDQTFTPTGHDDENPEVPDDLSDLAAEIAELERAEAAEQAEQDASETDIPDAEGDDPRVGGPATAKRATTSKAFVRRVAVKTRQVIEAPTPTTSLLAGLLGVEDDPVELAVAIMAGDRGALNAIGDVTGIRELDPFEASVKTQEKGRARMRAMHTLLHALGEIETASMNSSDAKASITIAKAIHGIATASVEQMDAVLDLARRS